MTVIHSSDLCNIGIVVFYYFEPKHLRRAQVLADSKSRIACYIWKDPGQND
jgi:hypothetical protein